MSHWLQKVVELLQAETINLRELAILAGGDPKTFYIGTNLELVDIRGQDVSGMILPGITTKNSATDSKIPQRENEKERSELVVWTDALNYSLSILNVRQGRAIRMYIGFDTYKCHTYSEISNELNISEDKVREIIDFSFKKLRKNYKDFDTSLERYNIIKMYSGNTYLESLFHRIFSTKRQEERLSLLIDGLLSAPRYYDVLKIYGQAETDLVKRVTDRLREKNKKGDLSISEKRIEILRALDYAIKTAFPYSRVELLLALSKHLSKHKMANEMIRRAVNRSGSSFVLHNRDQILANLEENYEEMGSE